MPVVCDACGASNRANAMFCSGCAGRLPGFAPSGPSALDVVGSSRPGPREDMPGARPDWALPPGSSIRILPAERPAFWLRLGMLGLVMCVGFMAWFLYVTRKVDVPPVGGPGAVGISAAAAPPSASPPSAPAVEAVPAATTAAPVVDRPRPGAVAAAAAAADTGAAAAEPARRRTQAAEARWSARPSQPWQSNAARAQRSRDDASAAVERSLALARADDDRDRGLAADPGPPVAAGPGPQYEWARTPSRLYGDPGPPVIAGPGPLVDDSPRRAGSR